MSFTIVWRPKAIANLRNIVRFIGRSNPERAKSFGQELRAKVTPLADHPFLGKPGRPGLPAGTRELVAHQNYIYFYRVSEVQKIVEILNLKHASQQVP